MSKSRSDDEQTYIKECLQSNEAILQQLLQQQKTTNSHLEELGDMVQTVTQMLIKLSPVSSVAPA